MITTFTPTLDQLQKVQLRDFLLTCLKHEKLAEGRFPFASNTVCIYLNSDAYLLSRGSWYKGSSSIQLATENEGSVPFVERLSILLTLTQLCEASSELTEASSKAISRYLLGAFNELNRSLVVSAGESTGIAFASDGRVASKIDGEWMTPSGETVDVSDSAWTVCEAQLPEPVVRPVVETVAPSSVFTVGQRVHVAYAVGMIPETSSGDGTVIQLPVGNSPNYRVDIEGHGGLWVHPDTMTPLAPPTPTFSIGQRVRYARIPHLTEVAGEGVVEIEPYDYSGGARMDIVDDNGDSYFVNVSDCSPIIEPTPVRAFAVGDRVRWTPDQDVNEGYEAGTGVIDQLTAGGDAWYLHMDEGYRHNGSPTSIIYAEAHELTHLEDADIDF